MTNRSAMLVKMPFLRNIAVVVLAGLCGVMAPLAADAQAHKKKPSSVEGSPLDTLLSSHLWTTPPPAKDFVRETRPDATTLDYTPLTGKDPERPKLRDTKGVQALQAELEGGIQRNEKRAKVLGGVKKPARSASKSTASQAR